MVTAGLVTTLVLAPCVRAGGRTERGEVALGLTEARVVARRVTAGGVALFEVADWWMEHGTMELVVGAGRAVEVAGGLPALGALVGEVRLVVLGVGLVPGRAVGRLLMEIGVGTARRVVGVGTVAVGVTLAKAVE